MSEHDQQQVSRTLGNRLELVGGRVSQALVASQVQIETPVSTDKFFSFWDALYDLSPPDVGLRFANETPVHEYPIYTLVALHSPNVRTALEKIARYKRLCGLTEVSVEHQAGEVAVKTTWIHTTRTTPALLVDVVLASQLALLRRGAGYALAPKRVELLRKRAGEVQLQRFFGCPIRFEASRDALVLEERSLEIPFITRNDDLLAALLPGLEAQLAPLLDHSFIATVRSTVVRRMRGEKPSVEKIARELSMSPRTLQRRLMEQGVSYQTLLDQVRHTTALSLLRMKTVDVSEIAFLLGFEEINSFSRAFRVWEGTTPNRWRSSVA